MHGLYTLYGGSRGMNVDELLSELASYSAM